DIGPHIPAEVDQNGIDPPHGVEMGGEVIVMFDLRSELLALESERTFNELVTQFHPVLLRESDMMGVEVTRCSAKFGRKRYLNQQVHLVLYPFDENRQLLAQAGWAGGLSMRTGQHGYVFPVFCQQLYLPIEIQQ